MSGCASTPEPTPETGTGLAGATPAEQQALEQRVPSRPIHVEKISLVAVGDIMLGTDFPENRLPPEQGPSLLSGVTSALRDADITFGNYEGTLLDGGEAAKECKNPQHCYVFRTPTRFVPWLTAAGFDVMSLANNHARDFGDEGRQASMQALDAAGIYHSGLEGDIASWEVGGLRVALIAYAPFRGAHNPLEIDLARTQIAALATNHDLVLVSMHMGAEGEEATRLPFAEEYFHGERRGDSVAFARAVVDAGADLVIGHGPHVPRAIELYRERLIAYSLGNFCTYYGINVRGLNGLAPILRIEMAADGRFLAGEITSARQVRPGGPQLDASHEAARMIAALTQLDFPHTPLEISATGRISRKTRVITPSGHNHSIMNDTLN